MKHPCAVCREIVWCPSSVQRNGCDIPAGLVVHHEKAHRPLVALIILPGGTAMNAETNLGIDRVRGAERIASLDVLRGIAILFILYMNIPGMGGYEMAIQDFRYPT
jgi:hypothetical protein